MNTAPDEQLPGRPCDRPACPGGHKFMQGRTVYRCSGTAAAPDTCRPVTLPDGQTISVRGSGDLTDAGRHYLNDIVAATTRRYAAEHPQEFATAPDVRPGEPIDRAQLRRVVADALRIHDNTHAYPIQGGGHNTLGPNLTCARCAIAHRMRTAIADGRNQAERAEDRRARYAAAMREHYLATDRTEADADGRMPCRCGDWREPSIDDGDEYDWDAHLADVIVALDGDDR